MKRWTLDQGVNGETKLADLAPFLDFVKETTRKSLKEAAVAKYGDPWDLTIGRLFEYLHGDFEFICVDVKRPGEMTVLQYFYIEAFKDTAEAIMKTLEALKPPQSRDAEQAAKACKTMTFEESTLIFLRDYFGLHSFKDVRSLKIEDLLLAKKDRYNQAAFEQARIKIIEQKNKTRR